MTHLDLTFLPIEYSANMKRSIRLDIFLLTEYSTNMKRSIRLDIFAKNHVMSITDEWFPSTPQMPPSAFQVLCKDLLRKEFVTNLKALCKFFQFSSGESNCWVNLNECIMQSIRKFDATSIISKNLQSAYKAFSKGFQSISPQSDLKLIRNPFLSINLQRTLKALGGLCGVAGDITVGRCFQTSLHVEISPRNHNMTD